ncbi:MAG: CsgG/HfaB family protein, partial [Gemmatimonadaceae bacterium]
MRKRGTATAPSRGARGCDFDTGFYLTGFHLQIMRRIHSLIPAAGLAALAACAGAGAPPGNLTPERTERAVAEARAELAANPSNADARLRLGSALYQAAQDSAARVTLAPIIETPGRVGFLASLYDAAAAERHGDLAAARRGYARYLTWKRDGDVEARLAEVTRREAEAAARVALANERALDPAQFPERTVAVAPLRVDAADSSIAPLGYGVADLLMTDLARSSRLRVVERLHVDALLRELKLGETQHVDSATAPRVGRLLGARRMVDGSLTALPGGEVRIDARVADVPTAAVSGALSERTQLERILDAEKALAFRLLDELG